MSRNKAWKSERSLHFIDNKGRSAREENVQRNRGRQEGTPRKIISRSR